MRLPLAMLVLAAGCINPAPWDGGDDLGFGPAGCHVQDQALVWTEPGIWDNRSAATDGLPVDEPDPWDAFHAGPSWHTIKLADDGSYRLLMFQPQAEVLVLATSQDVAIPDSRGAWLVEEGTWNATRQRIIEDMGDGHNGRHFVGRAAVIPDADSWFQRVEPELQLREPGRLFASRGDWSLAGHVPTAELPDGRVIDAGDRVQTPFGWIDATNETAIDEVRRRLPEATFVDVGFYVRGYCTDVVLAAYVPLEEAHRLPDALGTFG